MLGEQLQPIDALSQDLERSPVFPSSEKRAAATIRSTISLKVVLNPASTSQRRTHTLNGKTKNVSPSGCGVLTDIPALVGDLYRFRTPEDIDSPMDGVIARCVRCQMIDEDVFESGFQFVSSIVSGTGVTSALQNLSDDLL